METLDIIARDIGASQKGVGEKRILIADNMEDALIAAFDAGLTAEEIADIQLGSIS
jgi:hypothetical protein